MAIDRNPLRSREARSPARGRAARGKRTSIKQRYLPRLEVLEDRYMPALPGFSIVDAFVAEGNSGTTTVQFRILLDQAASGQVRVDYSTVDGGTATPGVDFVPTSGNVVFAPGQQLQVITVPIIGDTTVEGAESIVINLSNATGGAIIVDNMAIATIADEEYATTAPVDPLNQSFGTGGTATQGSFIKGDDVAVDGNDRAVVVGGALGFTEVVRYNPNGTLDKTFGGGGTVDIGQVSPGGVAAYTQGAFRDYVIVGGTSITGPSGDISVTRLNPDGTPDGAADSTPDTKFGGNGTVTLDLGGDEVVSDVEVKATGEVVVTGTSSTAGGTQAFVVVFKADGTVQSVTMFNVAGQDVTSVGDIAIDPAGNILIAGTYVDSVGVVQGFTARVRPTGGLDASYSGGVVPLAGLDSASGIAVSSTGQIVVSGEVGEKATLVGLKTSGAVDTAFGTNGVVTEPAWSAYKDVDFDTLGNLVVTGADTAGAQVIARYTASGQPDATFNTANQSAFIVIDNPSTSDEGEAVAIAGNGQIFTVGTADTGGSFASMTTTSVQSARADIVVTATPTSQAVVVGDTVGVAYTVTNNGPQPSGEVTATANLSSSVILISSSVPFTQSGSTITWQLGTLAPGQTVTINATFQPTATGLGAPFIVAYGNIPDPDTTNNFGTPNVFVGDIFVSPTEIVENSPSGTVVGVVLTSDEESTPLSPITIVSGVGDAALFTIDASGNLVALVPLDFEESPTRTVTITGISTSSGLVYTRKIDITVLDANDPPVAVDDNLFTVEDSPIVFSPSDLLANDTDQDAGAILIFDDPTSSPSNGTLSPFGSSFIYQPNPGFSGIDSFTYLITDGLGTTSTATVFINVAPINHPPVGTDDPLIGTFEDSGAFVIPFATLLANDSPGSGDGGSVTIAGVNSAVGGTVAIVGTNVVFTPTPNYNGPARFNYVLVDDGGAVALVNPLVTFAVFPINDAPTGTPDSIGNVAEDSGARVIPFSQLLANDGAGAPDEAGQSLTIVGVNSASGGTAVIVGTNIVFTPAPDYFGPASFTYVVQDNGFSGDLFDPRATAVPVTFTVTAVNDAPTAIDLVLPTVVGGAFLSPASFTAGATAGPANETGQSLSVVSVSNVVGGVVTVTSAGVFFVPNPGFTGVASFTYTLADNGFTAGVFDPRLATATVRFTVGSSLPSAAGALGNNNVTTLVVPGVPRLVETQASTVARSESVAYVALDSIRILVPPNPTARAATWGDVDARLLTVAPLFQDRVESRPVGPSTISPGDLTGTPEAPRRGRLMQIVNSQFDGEDNVNIFEQLLGPPSGSTSTGPGGVLPNANPGGAAAPIPPAPPPPGGAAVSRVEPLPPWREHLTSFGMGFLLVAGFFANLALAPIVDRRPFAQPKPREKKRKM